MSKELKQLRKLLSYQPDKTDWWGEEKELIALEINNCLNNIEKQLKALEIIKESIPIEEEDFVYDEETDTYFFIGDKVSKEQFDLLREVML